MCSFLFATGKYKNRASYGCTIPKDARMGLSDMAFEAGDTTLASQEGSMDVLQQTAMFHNHAL